MARPNASVARRSCLVRAPHGGVFEVVAEGAPWVTLEVFHPNGPWRVWNTLRRDRTWWVTVRGDRWAWPLLRERFRREEEALQRQDALARSITTGSLRLVAPAWRRRWGTVAPGPAQ
jgi:hypothetical protein